MKLSPIYNSAPVRKLILPQIFNIFFFFIFVQYRPPINIPINILLFRGQRLLKLNTFLSFMGTMILFVSPCQYFQFTLQILQIGLLLLFASTFQFYLQFTTLVYGRKADFIALILGFRMLHFQFFIQSHSFLHLNLDIIFQKEKYFSKVCDQFEFANFCSSSSYFVPTMFHTNFFFKAVTFQIMKKLKNCNQKGYKVMANEKIITRLPRLLMGHFSEAILSKHSVCAIGYGSGVFPQSSQVMNNTVDVMLIVKDRNDFHGDMIKYQPNDYAGLTRFFGSGYVNFLNKNIFPAHFNHVQVQDTKLKYAVIDLQTLLSDLRSWKLLTFAGRLHKPVVFNILDRAQPQELLNCLKNNHKMALNIAILNMIGKVRDNEPIPMEKLYKTISNVSYAGDIRHTMAVENANKVDNIVTNNRLAFDSLYQPLLNELSNGLGKGCLTIEDSNKFRLRYSPELINRIFQHDPFPEVLKEHFESINQNQSYKNITQKVLLNGVSNIPKEIQQKLSQINRNSSIRMAAQNFLGASLIHNMKYILAKIKKRTLK